MDRVTFIVDTNGELAWVYPEFAPDLTNDQAHTIAIAKLAASINRLADAVQQVAEKGGA